MSDTWELHGTEFSNCNCDWGCPCQFNSPSTHGNCKFTSGGQVERGFFNNISLDGLRWAVIAIFPGEIAEGNGRQQIIIDESATPEQREALRKIVFGESTEPGATHFNIFASMSSEMLAPVYLPIDYAINIAERTGYVKVPGLMDVKGSPIIDEFTGEPFHASIGRPKGSFEYTHAEIGMASSKTEGELAMALNNSYGQFNELHFNQSGVI
ncbi:hypothetical protein imdm_1126 [gamma proteobacterium IMCC2047]|nr:hypothetical protein imdm_1126 [gamma proteobacterium IMCC2047]